MSSDFNLLLKQAERNRLHCENLLSKRKQTSTQCSTKNDIRRASNIRNIQLERQNQQLIKGIDSGNTAFSSKDCPEINATKSSIPSSNPSKRKTNFVFTPSKIIKQIKSVSSVKLSAPVESKQKAAQDAFSNKVPKASHSYSQLLQLASANLNAVSNLKEDICPKIVNKISLPGKRLPTTNARGISPRVQSTPNLNLNSKGILKRPVANLSERIVEKPKKVSTLGTTAINDPHPVRQKFDNSRERLITRNSKVAVKSLKIANLGRTSPANGKIRKPELKGQNSSQRLKSSVSKEGTVRSTPLIGKYVKQQNQQIFGNSSKLNRTDYNDDQEEDEDDEDSDLDGFIVNSDEDDAHMPRSSNSKQISQAIQSLFKHNRHSRPRIDDSDDDCMESSFADIMKEEKQR
ncbi:hypothetical protein GJ496_004470 [Pomphorhynchus laevis]|nr:hypothetical protein GJ496_004470 [Pomphorhynchus laevis]